MKHSLTHQMDNYEHKENEVSEISKYFSDLEKERKQLSVWYVVYEEVIIFSLLVTLFATAI